MLPLTTGIINYKIKSNALFIKGYLRIKSQLIKIVFKFILNFEWLEKAVFF